MHEKSVIHSKLTYLFFDLKLDAIYYLLEGVNLLLVHPSCITNYLIQKFLCLRNINVLYYMYFPIYEEIFWYN